MQGILAQLPPQVPDMHFDSAFVGFADVRIRPVVLAPHHADQVRLGPDGARALKQGMQRSNSLRVRLALAPSTVTVRAVRIEGQPVVAEDGILRRRARGGRSNCRPGLSADCVLPGPPHHGGHPGRSCARTNGFVVNHRPRCAAP